MSYSKRRRVIAGNWKMFKTQAETRAFFAAFNPLVASVTDCDIVIAPPAVDIPAAVEATKGTHIAISAQNVYWEKEGAFTGEISAGMVAEAGCRYTIIGHSERRHIFGVGLRYLCQTLRLFHPFAQRLIRPFTYRGASGAFVFRG